MSLENKVAIITGAGQGIGRGIAEALAREKCSVVISDLNLKNCKLLAEQLEKNGARALATKCDVSKKNEVKKLFKDTIAKFGRVDILVNNAGIFPFIAFEKMTEEDWDKVINVNLKSIFLTCSEATRAMEKGGRIINISSIAAFVGFSGLTHYCASKGAITGMIRALALELAPKQITVNAVAPGAIETPGATQPEEMKKQTISTIPLSRMGKPEDIADAVVFLASNKASYITGQSIIVDGGWTLK